MLKLRAIAGSGKVGEASLVVAAALLACAALAAFGWKIVTAETLFWPVLGVIAGVYLVIFVAHLRERQRPALPVVIEPRPTQTPDQSLFEFFFAATAMVAGGLLFATALYVTSFERPLSPVNQVSAQEKSARQACTRSTARLDPLEYERQLRACQAIEHGAIDRGARQ